jgi:hypothetical protein
MISSHIAQPIRDIVHDARICPVLTSMTCDWSCDSRRFVLGQAQVKSKKRQILLVMRVWRTYQVEDLCRSADALTAERQFA